MAGLGTFISPGGSLEKGIERAKLADSLGFESVYTTQIAGRDAFTVLGAFLPCCEARGDGARRERYEAHRGRLRAALEDAGWDGGWYRRAYLQVNDQ